MNSPFNFCYRTSASDEKKNGAGKGFFERLPSKIYIYVYTESEGVNLDDAFKMMLSLWKVTVSERVLLLLNYSTEQ